MEATSQLAWIVVASGFVLAFVFGFAAQKTDFCTMGAVADIVNMGDWTRMRMWLLAIAVAIAGANALDLAGLVDLSRSAYPAPGWPWLAHIAGGLMFGVGMTLASGCGSRSLVRIGGGNLKSVVAILFLALGAEMTIRGVLSPLRTQVLSAFPIRFDQGQDLSWLLASTLGTGKRVVQPWLAALVALPLFAFVLKDREFRSDRTRLFAAAVIGLVIVGGWYVTGHVGFIAEDPKTLQEAYVGTKSARPESFTFIGPAANALELLQFWTDKSARLNFGVAVIAGTLAGAFVYAVSKRRFHWESFASAADLRNHMIGGALMGFGGVCAMGCTIGQGITGVSTLAIGSFVVFFSIVAGATATMKVQYRLMLKETATAQPV
ncbi:MAG TPA: YeeE/YedE family protein [Burkholderiales bacterium]|nr:YeeE/YedE family protein [Burkholderiales bacterium]